MSEDQFEKEFGPVDAVRERTGIYGLGFDRAAFTGFMLPFIVTSAGVVGALLIYFFL